MAATVSSATHRSGQGRRFDDPRWHLLLIVLIVVPLYAVNGRWGQSANGDTTAVAVPAWQLANEGTLDLSEFEVIADNLDGLGIWYVNDVRGRIVSNRMPGLIAMTTPAYLASGDDFSNAPATATALTATVAALLLMWHVFRKLVPLVFATSSILVFALGTTTWAISAAEIWPHGPGQLWAAMAVLFTSGGAYLATGVAFALSITTRPLTGIFAAVTGIAESWRLRSFLPAFKVALASSVGLAALLIYNRYLYGSWSLSGGYSDSFTTGALESFEFLPYLNNLLAVFIGPLNGFLTTSPVIGVAAYGVVRYRDRVQPWMLSLAASGIVYLIVHAALNRASGGLIVFYRYPLAPLVLMSPALLMGARALWESSRRGERVVVVTALVSVALQVLNIFVFSCWNTSPVVPTCVLS